MAKDITVRVTGQNPDGTMNISVPDGTNNPFMQSSQTAMVPYNPSPQAQTVGYRARMGSVEVMFASEADFLKADKAFREQVQVANVPVVGGGGMSGSGNSMLRTGASIGEAAAAYYNGRAIRKRIDELAEALEAQRRTQDALGQYTTKYPELVPALVQSFQAERDATLAMARLLEDQLLAVDIQTGAGVARVVSEVWDGSSATGSMFGSSSLMAGGVGLGLGLLLSRNDSNTNRNFRR
jgi:hypothetical protein